jgi:hypothetical protein
MEMLYNTSTLHGVFPIYYLITNDPWKDYYFATLTQVDFKERDKKKKKTQHK